MIIETVKANLETVTIVVTCTHAEHCALLNLRNELYRGAVLLERVKRTGKVDL